MQTTQQVCCTKQIGHLAKTLFNVELPLQVCESQTGFFIGTMHPKDGPYSRESVEYYPTREQAEQALETGDWNQLIYDNI